MKIIQKYQSDDGQEFDTEVECVKHERDIAMQKAEAKAEAKVKDDIKLLVYGRCDSEDYEGYSADNIAEFICRHFEEISEIINKDYK